MALEQCQEFLINSSNQESLLKMQNSCINHDNVNRYTADNYLITTSKGSQFTIHADMQHMHFWILIQQNVRQHYSTELI